ncbi:MAG: helix-turn-helix domain-containing protein, partial [Deltaproteobacteria bacterium]
SVVDAADVQFDEGSPPPALGALVDTRGRSFEQIEAQVYAAVMRDLKGNRNAASRQLGVSKKTLLRKLAAYGLEKVGLDEEGT